MQISDHSFTNFHAPGNNMTTIRQLQQGHFQRVGFLIAFGGSSFIWMIILMLILM